MNGLDSVNLLFKMAAGRTINTALPAFCCVPPQVGSQEAFGHLQLLRMFAHHLHSQGRWLQPRPPNSGGWRSARGLGGRGRGPSDRPRYRCPHHVLLWVPHFDQPEKRTQILEVLPFWGRLVYDKEWRFKN